MSAADVAAILAGLPAVAILTYRARRWHVARISDATISAREQRTYARTVERGARRMDKARAKSRRTQLRRDEARTFYERRDVARRAAGQRRYERTVQLLTYKERNR